MAWLQLTLDTSPQQAPQVETLLEEAGALAVSLADAADEPLYEPPLGATPLWSATRITGLFEEQADLEAAVARIAAELGEPLAWRTEVLQDRDWERVWLEDFHPMAFGRRLWVCPTGQPSPDPEAVNLWLDPGLAFGTGTHPTTALCLEWLDSELTPGTTLVDYGCGSGILALAALRLGASQAWAVDNDPQALWATLDNARKNDLIAHHWPAGPGIAELVEAGEGWEGLPLLVSVPQCVPLITTDLLLANILARPLVELAPRLVALVRPGGRVVLSGILESQGEMVAAAYRPWLALEPEPGQRDGWLRLVGVRRSVP